MFRAPAVVLFVSGLLVAGPALGQNKDNWIKLEYVGAQDKPMPTVVLVPQPIVMPRPFAPHDGAESIELPQRQYDQIARWSREFACAKQTAASDVVELTQAVNGGIVAFCRLPVVGACEYLEHVLDVLRNHSRPSPVVSLGRRLSCPAAVFKDD